MDFDTIKGYLLLNGFNYPKSYIYNILVRSKSVLFVFDKDTKDLLKAKYYLDEDVDIDKYQNSLFKITYERYPFYTIIFEPLKAYSYFLDKGSIVLTDEKSTIELPLDKNKFLEFIRNI